MAEITNLSERRQNDRHPVQNGGFVVLHPRQYFPKLGPMIDISLGGLAFQYHLESNIRLTEFTAVDIYFSGEGLCIGNIPVESVWSIDIPQHDPYFNITVKRYGVAFGSLSPDNMIQLNQFIQQYTVPT